ncbi:MAG: FKBP-type peptidyl-prolyl cis-trans isomerase [Tannerellaceae bacterium]
MSRKNKGNIYKESNLRFLEENKAKEGVFQLTGGVQYRIIEKGEGKIPGATSLVQVYYKGYFIDGKEFDSNLNDTLPALFRVHEVIEGWQDVLRIMPVGSTWEVFIPYTKGYGNRPEGNIKGFSSLIFEIKLVSIA